LGPTLAAAVKLNGIAAHVTMKLENVKVDNSIMNDPDGTAGAELGSSVNVKLNWVGSMGAAIADIGSQKAAARIALQIIFGFITLRLH
jgi:hypothetical protein